MHFNPRWRNWCTRSQASPTWYIRPAKIINFFGQKFRLPRDKGNNTTSLNTSYLTTYDLSNTLSPKKKSSTSSQVDSEKTPSNSVEPSGWLLRQLSMMYSQRSSKSEDFKEVSKYRWDKLKNDPRHESFCEILSYLKKLFCWKNCDHFVAYILSFCELNWTEDFYRKLSLGFI